MKAKRGLSRADWSEGALKLLRSESISGLTIERLARSMNIAKSGFYWHFKDRQELLDEVLLYWSNELTERHTQQLEASIPDPKQRLIATSELVLDRDLGRYEMAIRQWALQDPKVARVVRKTNKHRLDFVRRAFSELGFKDDELEARTMLFVCYTTWESGMFPEVSRKRRRQLLTERVGVLTRM